MPPLEKGVSEWSTRPLLNRVLLPYRNYRASEKVGSVKTEETRKKERGTGQHTEGIGWGTLAR